MDKVKGVEIDPVRERLIELIRYARYEVEGICDEQDRCDECPAENWCKDGYIADHLIASGVVVSIFETTTKWIPVTERLPGVGEKVLVCGCKSGIYTAYLDRDGKYPLWHKLNSKSHYCKPTHWMPLPPAPKGE